MSKKEIIIPEDCIPFLKENVPNYRDFTKLNDLLEEIEDIQLYKGFDKDDEPNDFGIKAERVYDKIYYANLNYYR